MDGLNDTDVAIIASVGVEDGSGARGGTGGIASGASGRKPSFGVAPTVGDRVSVV